MKGGGLWMVVVRVWVGDGYVWSVEVSLEAVEHISTLFFVSTKCKVIQRTR